MSESTGSGAANDLKSGEENENKFVNREAYENVSKDMHKYKAKTKDYEARIAQLEADQKAKEEAKLVETQQFQKLYEEEKKRAQELSDRLTAREKQVIADRKKSALKNALGNVNDEYLMFANLESIELSEDGNLNPDSVHKAANDFRAKHPQLLIKNEGSNITGKAPAPDANVTSGQVDLSKMSMAEKQAILTQKLKEQTKR